MRRYWLLFFTSQLLAYAVLAQNTNCKYALPFCTQIPYEYPATVDVSYSELGHDYGCLLYTKNPAWYYLLIEKGGDIELRLSSAPRADIDFVCWGPFTDFEQACLSGLPTSKVVDCSKEIDEVEFCYIPRTMPGEYYILMITNYSNSKIRIKLEQNSGSGSTDCSIVGPPLLFVPNAFSPNGDGLNDVFIANGDNISLFRMVISDRWGRVVFESNSIYHGWDGTVKGMPAEEGLYCYLILYEGQDLLQKLVKHKKGWVMLVR